MVSGTDCRGKQGKTGKILLGLLKGGANWLVKSNAETGDGYCDILVEGDQKLGFVIEIKYAEHQVFGRKCKEAL